VTPIWTRTPRVVVGVDDSDAARWALAWAVGEARLRGLPLLVVNAIPPSHAGLRATGMPLPVDVVILQEERAVALRKLLHDMTIPPELEVTTKCPYGHPGETLARLAHDGDLLVIGRAGRNLLSRLMTGSVRDYCARNAKATLVVVPVPSLSSLDSFDHALEGPPPRRRTKRPHRRY
jgi:nucleotide-binding universal stress UspA family protein